MSISVYWGYFNLHIYIMPEEDHLGTSCTRYENQCEIMNEKTKQNIDQNLLLRSFQDILLGQWKARPFDFHPGGVLPRFLYAGVPLGDCEPHPSIRRVSAEILTLF